MIEITDALGAQLTLTPADAEPELAPGQFWIAGFDGASIALVLVVATRGRTVLAWPVSGPSQVASAPAFSWSIGDRGVVVWPEAEFGLSTVTLETFVAEGPHSKVLRLIVGAIEDREPLPIEQLPTLNDRTALAALDAMCRQAWSLADLEWPRAVPDQAVLDPEVIEEAGIGPAVIQTAVRSAAPGHAADLASGRALVNSVEFSRLRDLLADRELPHALVPAFGVDVDEMSLPMFKRRIAQVAVRSGSDEASTRSRVLARSRRAARQEAGSERDQARSRLMHAIEELLKEAP